MATEAPSSPGALASPAGCAFAFAIENETEEAVQLLLSASGEADSEVFEGKVSALEPLGVCSIAMSFSRMFVFAAFVETTQACTSYQVFYRGRVVEAGATLRVMQKHKLESASQVVVAGSLQAALKGDCLATSVTPSHVSSEQASPNANELSASPTIEVEDEDLLEAPTMPAEQHSVPAEKPAQVFFDWASASSTRPAFQQPAASQLRPADPSLRSYLPPPQAMTPTALPLMSLLPSPSAISSTAVPAFAAPSLTQRAPVATALPMLAAASSGGQLPLVGPYMTAMPSQAVGTRLNVKPPHGWHALETSIQVYSQSHSRWFEDGAIIGIALQPSLYSGCTMPPGSLFVVFNSGICSKGIPPDMFSILLR